MSARDIIAVARELSAHHGGEAAAMMNKRMRRRLAKRQFEGDTRALLTGGSEIGNASPFQDLPTLLRWRWNGHELWASRPRPLAWTVVSSRAAVAAPSHVDPCADA